MSVNPALHSQVGKQDQMTYSDWMLWTSVRNETPSEVAAFWYVFA